MPRPARPATTRKPARAQISAEQLASLSHEFRTPLNGVLGMARLLQGTKLTEEQRSYVSALHDSGEHLLTLVNDVLDFAKLGAGRVELHPGPTRLEGLLQGVTELLSPRARERHLEIAWAVADAAMMVQVDEGRLRQILLNFAGNAVKFTETGGVLLTVERVGTGRVRFTVRDTGPGVPDAEQDRIFEAFAQVDAAHAELGGAGLGLAIVRRLARAMNGEVGVDTPAEGGAAFWFEAVLPIIPDDAADLPLDGHCIGVASPSAIVREAAARQIRASGGRVVSGASIDDTLASIGPTDVLLVDSALTSTAGAFKPPAGRRAIVLLAPDERGQIARYRRAGFAGYLIKPLRRASLVERVLIAAGGAIAAVQPSVDERVAAAASPGLRVLLVEDNPINALLARTLLTREGCVVEHAVCGRDALIAAAVGTFDLILMDMRMPGLSGVETAQRLRDDGIETPIVALTANAFEDDRHACLTAGMNDFLVKPLSPDALRTMLARWSAARWTKPAARAKVG